MKNVYLINNGIIVQIKKKQRNMAQLFALQKKKSDFWNHVTWKIGSS